MSTDKLDRTAEYGYGLKFADLDKLEKEVTRLRAALEEVDVTLRNVCPSKARESYLQTKRKRIAHALRIISDALEDV